MLGRGTPVLAGLIQGDVIHRLSVSLYLVFQYAVVAQCVCRYVIVLFSHITHIRVRVSHIRPRKAVPISRAKRTLHGCTTCSCLSQCTARMARVSPASFTHVNQSSVLRVGPKLRRSSRLAAARPSRAPALTIHEHNRRIRWFVQQVRSFLISPARLVLIIMICSDSYTRPSRHSCTKWEAHDLACFCYLAATVGTLHAGARLIRKIWTPRSGSPTAR